MAFGGEEFIRIGSVTKKLREYPEKERDLWRIFDRVIFEHDIAAERVSDEDVLLKLDYPAYFDLLEMPLPDGRAAILDALRQDYLIERSGAGGWNVTNLGAILLARKLDDFPSLRRKAMRVIKYSGAGRFDASTEREDTKGYAAAFTAIVDHVMALVPSNEVIEQSLRRTVPMFPEIAVRELVSNALIHQDFSATGAGPMVEIFDDRIEITSPGEPLVDTERFMDTPPKSRNETLASLMRRFRICEERGSGIDKVVSQVEAFQLPAPLFEAPGDFTRAILFAHKPLSGMGKAERVRACSMHACLRYVMGQPMNNSSLRGRFGIPKGNTVQASRLLKEALESGAIIIRDPEAGYRIRTYLPSWAGSHSTGEFPGVGKFVCTLFHFRATLIMFACCFHFQRGRHLFACCFHFQRGRHLFVRCFPLSAVAGICLPVVFTSSGGRHLFARCFHFQRGRHLFVRCFPLSAVAGICLPVVFTFSGGRHLFARYLH